MKSYFTPVLGYTQQASAIASEFERFALGIYEREHKNGGNLRELTSILLSAIMCAEGSTVIRIGVERHKQEIADLILAAETKFATATDADFVTLITREKVEAALAVMKSEKRDISSRSILKFFLKGVTVPPEIPEGGES